MTARTAYRDALRAHPLFSALETDAFEAALRGARTLALADGELAFQRGERASRFFVVLSGAVQLVLQSRDGDERVIETLRAGQAYAEAFAFDDAPAYPLAGIAREAAVLAAVPINAYRGVLTTSPETCGRLLAGASRRMQALLREVETHALDDARTRIVRHVLELAGGAAAPCAPTEVTLPEPKQRIAARLGIAPETLSRTFRALRDAGLLAVQGRTVLITDLEALRAAA